MLVAISALSGFILKWQSPETTIGKVLQGLLFGFAAVIGILFPYVLKPGLIFDGRTIVIGICTMFFGPLAGGISALASAIARILIGGVDLIGGLLEIIGSFVFGWVFFNIIRKRGLIWATNTRIYLFGLLVHIVMAIVLFSLPSRSAFNVLRSVTLTVILAFPIITLIIGYIVKTSLLGRNYLKEIVETHNRLRATLYSVGDAVIATDKNGIIQMMNPIAEKLTGWNEFSALGKHITKVFNIVNEFTGEKVENPVQKVLEKGTVYGLANHTLLISLDGTKYQIADTASPIFDDSGKIQGVVIIFRDQTEERRIQKIIEDSEKRYRKFVQTNVAGIWRFDINPPISILLPTDEQVELILEGASLAECNDAYARMYGYQKAEEILGIKLSDVFLPDDPTNLEVLHYFIKNGYRIENAESVEVDKFGNRKYFLNSYVGIVEDGNLVRAWGLQIDITEKKQLEEELKKSEEKFRTLSDSALVGVYMLSESGIIEYLNDAGANIFGYEASELLGKSVELIVHPDDLPIVRENIRRRVVGEVTAIRYDLRGIHKNGDIIYIEVFGKRIELKGKVWIIGTLIDNTEKKKQQIELEEKEQRLRSIFSISPNLYFIIDKEGRYLFVSPGKEQLLYRPSSEILGKTFDEVFEPEQAKLFLEKIRESLQKKEKVAFEYPLEIGGKTYYFQADVIPYKTDQVLAVIQDITERKRNELVFQIRYNIALSLISSKNLKEFLTTIRSEISKLFDTTNFFVAFYDDEKNMLTAPFEWDEKQDSFPTWSAEKSLTGKVVKEKKSLLLKQNEISQLIESSEIVRIGTASKCWMGVPLIIGGEAIGAIVIQSYDNPNEYSNNDLLLFEQIASEISTFILTKKQEEELRKLSTAIHSAPIAVVVTDSEGVIEYINPKFTELTGYSLDEAVGNTPRILKSGYHPLEFYQNLWKVIKSGNVWKGELRNRKKSGELYWENSIISPIFDENGKITHFVGLKQDITKEKKMLEELIIAKEKAEESDKLKTAFLSNLSHEVRTPLNAIIGFSQILGQGKVTTHEISQFGNIIKQRGLDLLRLFNDLIDISHLQTGQLRLSYSSGNGNSLLYDLFTIFQTSEPLKQKHLELRIGKTFDEDFIITTDFFRVQQILSNLIDNAIKYTYHGSVEFGGYSREDGKIEFYVKDTGPGIPSDKLDRIFEQFYKLETNILTSGPEGLGIGLSIARGLTKLLGGEIWVESTVGQGSTFFFTITPAIEKDKSKEIPKQKFEQTQPSKYEKRYVFMIVEDDSSNYKLLERVLNRSFNCELIYAQDGKEAIEKFTSHRNIDLVFLDIRIPKIDGFGVLSEMRKLKPNQKIIAVTAYAYPEDRRRLLRFGFDEYIAKPIDFEQLIGTIQKVLEK